MDDDLQLVAFVDQMQAALKEVFKERGYDVKVEIPKGVPEEGTTGVGIGIDCKEEVTEELIDSVVREAMTRVEGHEFGFERFRPYEKEEGWKNEDDEGEEWKNA